MVGDWPERDIDGAKGVCMKTAFAKYGNLDIDQNKIEADLILNDIYEIIKYIKKVNRL